MFRVQPWLWLGVLVGLASVTTTTNAAAKKHKKHKKHAAVAVAPDPAPEARPLMTAVAAPKDEISDFDKQAATNAINEVSLQKCKVTNAEKGDGHVMITFTPAGIAQAAVVDKGPWVGSPVAKCMAKAFKKVKVPPFTGETVTVGKTFHFE